jgi:pyruvate formate-lyase activating enzyme-like uncharacterized protein
MLAETDDLAWLARKAAAALRPRLPEPDPALAARLERRLGELSAAGVKGDAASLTLFTKAIPAGCRSCLKGRGTNLYVTGHCTRDCFFCFNHKPRTDELVVHGIKVRTPEDAAAVVERYDLRSVGISGGEPLLQKQRVLAVLAALRALRRALTIDLYTNGDRLDAKTLRQLKDAGLSGLRINMAAREYNLAPLALALRFFPDAAVEIPAVPSELSRQKKLILDLECLGARWLNLHELFVCKENEDRMAAQGYTAVDGGHDHLLWSPVPESGEAALELLLFAKRHARQLSVYYCSCGTQELISRRGLSRRRACAA